MAGIDWLVLQEPPPPVGIMQRGAHKSPSKKPCSAKGNKEEGSTELAEETTARAYNESRADYVATGDYVMYLGDNASRKSDRGAGYKLGINIGQVVEIVDEGTVMMTSSIFCSQHPTASSPRLCFSQWFGTWVLV